MSDNIMTFEQFQATKIKHTNTADSLSEHTDSDTPEREQAFIYLANDSSYDPSRHHSNYLHIDITPTGYECMLDRSLYETTDLEKIERAMFDMLIEWGEIT